MFSDTKFPIKQAQKLLLHEVDFREAEPKVLVATNSCITCPVLVLGRRVVEVLGREDERSQEDSMGSALHALGNRRQTFL